MPIISCQRLGRHGGGVSPPRLEPSAKSPGRPPFNRRSRHTLDSFRRASYVRTGLMAPNSRDGKASGITHFLKNPRRAAAAPRIIMAKLKFRRLHDRVVVKRID